MRTKAVRLYGKQDLRLEEFELPRSRMMKSLLILYRTVFACRLTRPPFKGLIINESPRTLRKTR